MQDEEPRQGQEAQPQGQRCPSQGIVKILPGFTCEKLNDNVLNPDQSGADHMALAFLQHL